MPESPAIFVRIEIGRHRSPVPESLNAHFERIRVAAPRTTEGRGHAGVPARTLVSAASWTMRKRRRSFDGRRQNGPPIRDDRNVTLNSFFGPSSDPMSHSMAGAETQGRRARSERKRCDKFAPTPKAVQVVNGWARGGPPTIPFPSGTRAASSS